MTEYISKQAVLADIEKTIEESGCVNHEGEIIDCVRYATAAAVAPVVPSKWILLDDEERPRCANCEHIALLEADEMYSLSNYCPNCGANMTGNSPH